MVAYIACSPSAVAIVSGLGFVEWLLVWEK
jgi:hypothetical protein